MKGARTAVFRDILVVMLLRMGAFVLPLLLVIFALVSNRVSAQATVCPPPTVPIPADQRAAATAAGIPISATCWNPNDRFTGQAVGEAKTWLRQHAVQNANVACLNSEFAQRLKNLMEAVPGGPPTITDGYRSPERQQAIYQTGGGIATQANACSTSAYHNYGMAADFNNENRERLLWMRQNAARFGLTPITTLDINTGCSRIAGSRFCDPGHIQMQGSVSGQCGQCSTGSDGTLPANTGTTASNAPLGLGDYARASLTNSGLGYGLGTQSPYGYQQPLLPMQPQLPMQPLTSAQPITSAFVQPTTSLIPQTTTQSQTGTSNQINTNTNTNQNTNTGTSTSIADQLLNLAFGTVTATSGSSLATSTPIVITGAQAGSLAYVSGQQPQQSTSSIGAVGGLSPVGQQTFTSNDLRYQPQQSTVYSGDTYSRLVQLYTALRDTLTRIFEYLRPFGGGRAPQTIHE